MAGSGVGLGEEEAWVLVPTLASSLNSATSGPYDLGQVILPGSASVKRYWH